MKNQKVFDYAGITDFHNRGFRGKGFKIGYWDMDKDNRGLYHAPASFDVIYQVCDLADIIYYKYGSIEKTLRKMVEDNLDFLNISMSGIDVEFTFNNKIFYPSWNPLKQKTIIYASNGNSGKVEEFKPAALKEVIGITSCNDANKSSEFIPRFSEYSTRNNKTMFCDCGTLELTKPLDGRHVVRGTSFASPLAMGKGVLLAEAFQHKFGKKADRHDILYNSMAMAVDLEEKGRDEKTGFGFVRLDYDKIIDYVYWTKKNIVIPYEDWCQIILDKAKKGRVET